MSDSLIATRYQLKTEFRGSGLCFFPVTFDRLKSPFYKGEKWAVRRGGLCLNKDKEWEYEPLPSSRDEEFYSRCRFDSLESAKRFFESAT